MSWLRHYGDAEKDAKHVNKREERKLVQQYSKQESIGSNLGELLKAALEQKKE